MNKRTLLFFFILFTLSVMCFATGSFKGGYVCLAEENKLKTYYGTSFHGNMMGKIITADMIIIDDEKIEFTANTPGGKKNHTYFYVIKSSTNDSIVTEWYENGKLDKTVTFNTFREEEFVIEVKGKGKVSMKRR